MKDHKLADNFKYVKLIFSFSALCVLVLHTIYSCDLAKDPNFVHHPKMNVIPKAYQLTIKPDLVSETWEGEATIDLEITTSQKFIELHSSGLEIINVTCQGVAVSWRLMEEFVKVRYDFVPGRTNITFKYRGKYGFGFYVSDIGQFKIAYTNFEPIRARSVFPCVDIPSIKSLYDISLIIPDGAYARSNALAKTVINIGGGFKKVNFATTIPLPTYLVAWYLEFKQLSVVSKLCADYNLTVLAEPNAGEFRYK